MVSSPPPVRFKLLLFGIFVLLVAVTTFMVLYIIKPFEGAPKRPPVITENQAVEEVQATPKTSSQPEEKAPTKKESPAPATTAVSDQKPDAPDPEPAPSEDTKTTVGVPACREEAGAWQISFRTGSDPKFKHFTLKDPPRLAVDFLKASYTGQEKLLDCPAPFISKIRVGEKPEYTRFVIDFGKPKVPKYEAVAESESVIVKFRE